MGSAAHQLFNHSDDIICLIALRATRGKDNAAGPGRVGNVFCLCGTGFVDRDHLGCCRHNGGIASIVDIQGMDLRAHFIHKGEKPAGISAAKAIYCLVRIAYGKDRGSSGQLMHQLILAGVQVLKFIDVQVSGLVTH